MRPPRITLKVEFKGRDIFSYPTKKSYVTHSPFYEWIGVALWANMTPDDFFKLPGRTQSLLVAAHRTEMQIEAVMNKEAEKQSRRNSRRKGR